MEMNVTTVSAFKANCRYQLAGYNLEALRAYGREIGVVRATEKKKAELIEDIISVLAGEKIPNEKTNRGAPVKNNYVDPALVREMDELRRLYFPKQVEGTETPFDFAKEYAKLRENQFEFQFNSPLKEEGVTELPEEKNYEGQFERIGGIPCVVPLSGNRSQREKILLPDEVIERYSLGEGDMVLCSATKSKTAYVVTQISRINAYPAGMITRVRFEDAEIDYPKQPLFFDSMHVKDSALSVRTLQWLMRIRRGQRGCIIAPPKAGKTTLLFDMAKSSLLHNRDVCLFVLLLDQTPETVVQYKNEVPHGQFMYTTYEDDCDTQVFAAEFLLKRAKRFAESGQHVLFLVDSFNALARAYNETDASAGGKTLPGGIESKTVYYLKNYLGSARSLKGKGTLTMIGTLVSDSGNPADETLLAEMTSVSNLEIYLDGDLALKHIFPNLDLRRSRSFDARYPDEGVDSLHLDDYLKREYLPRYSLEEMWLMIQPCKTYEEVYTKAQKAVKAATKPNKNEEN